MFLREILAATIPLGLSTLWLSGCAVGQFDVPTDASGQPTVKSIWDRVQCEMRDMVRDDVETVDNQHSALLLNDDYDVEVTLTVEVNDTGGIQPSLSYINPLSKIANFTLAATATLSEARDDKFTAIVQLSFRTIYTEWKTGVNLHECPSPNTNLAGSLGLSRYVNMAAFTPRLDSKQNLAGKGVFGATDQFTVTKNLSALGATWTLTSFKGPGAVNISEVNTDSILLAFARGPNAGKKMPPLHGVIPPNPTNKDARALTQQLISQYLSTGINQINNSLQSK